jgi:UDP-glucose 4-epimerase
MAKYDLIGIDLPRELFDEDEETLKWQQTINHVDLRDDASFYSFLLDGVDTIIHCAARTRINASWNEYSDYYATNITASQQLFAAAQQRGVKKFVYFSSSSVYGNSPNPIQSETDPLQPTNPYAVSKMAAEYALRAQASLGNTELIIVRPFTMYGEYMSYGKYSLVIAKFLKAFARNDPLMIDGNGEQRRDFVHAEDAMAALELIMEYGEDGDVFNIGTGQTVSVNELANIVSHRQIRVPDRPGPVASTCADISRLQALGYEPKIKVVDWLTSQVEELKLKTLFT